MDWQQQMNRAKDLIRAKQYDEAREILATVQHPTAEQWRRRLDEIAPPELSPEELKHHEPPPPDPDDALIKELKDPKLGEAPIPKQAIKPHIPKNYSYTPPPMPSGTGGVPLQGIVVFLGIMVACVGLSLAVLLLAA